MPSSGLGGIGRSLMGLLILAVALVGWLGRGAGAGGEAGDDRLTRSGRTPWTTSRVVGSPDPPRPSRSSASFPG